MNSGSTAAPKVTFERPWLGLSPFTEETQRFFFGRDREIGELYERIRGTPLTVLYGQSGLGKTSLLGAGLIPKLRVEGYRPLLLRLKYQPEDPPLFQQVGHALDELLGPQANPLKVQTLWERFHHRANFHPDLDEAPPVVLFDQFEEIFTLTEGSEDRQQEAEVLFHQLADLLENRPPSSVQERLRKDRSLGRDLDFGPSLLRVVVTLREDFLSRLEEWKAHLPSLMRNRMALHKLDGPSAFEAVYRPGRLGGDELVERAVAERIVCFVAKKKPETPLEEIRAVPPLLSLLCFELNEARRRDRTPTITADQVEGLGDDILEDFFERSFTGLDPAVRRFVEDELVSRGGHRNAVASGYALEKLEDAGVEDAAGALDHLVQARLLTAVEPGSRLEITHDVLAPYVVSSREQRQERERAERAELEAQDMRRRRSRFASAIMIVSLLAVAAFASAFWAYQAGKKADRLLRDASDKAFGSARISFEKHLDRRASLAYLAEAIWLWPSNEPASALAASSLIHQPTVNPLPVLELSGHSKQTNMVSFSPGGQRIVTASDDHTARIWSTETATQLTPPLKHSETVFFASFSPDGQLVATTSEDRTARVWNAETGTPKTPPLQHPNLVLLAEFSPDSKIIATGGVADEVRLWNIETGKALTPPLKLENSVSALSFSLDGNILLSGTWGGMLHVWDTRTGNQIGPPLEFTNSVTSIEIAPSGQWVIVGTLGTGSTKWQLGNRGIVGRPIEIDDESYSVALSPDGRWIATASLDGKIGIRGTHDIKLRFPTLESGDNIHSIEFSPDGRWLIIAGENENARILDAQTGAFTGSPLWHMNEVRAAKFSPNGQLVVTTSRNENAKFWQSSSGAPYPLKLQHEGSLNSADFSPDGEEVVTASSDQTARVWDSRNGASKYPPLQHEDVVRSASFSPNGLLIATASYDETGRVWDAPTGLPQTAALRHTGWVRTVAFSQDSRWVVTASDDHTATVWNAKYGIPRFAPLRHKDLVLSADFSPDGRWIITTDWSNLALVWDSRTGQQASVEIPHDATNSSPEIGPNENHLLSIVEDTAYIWTDWEKAYTGFRLQHKDFVHDAAFSPDGLLVATCSSDGYAALWTVGPEVNLSFRIEHGDRVKLVDFSPGGHRLLTTTWNDLVRIWDTVDGKPRTIPLLTGGFKFRPSMSPDGQHLLTASSRQDSAYVWEILTPKVSREASFDLKMISGFQLSTSGLLETIGLDRRLRWRDALLESEPDGSEWDRIVRWYLADPRTRPLSPNSAITVSEQIERQIDWVLDHSGTRAVPHILNEAYNLDPGHPLILLALTLSEDPHPATRELYLDLSMKRLSDEPRLAAKAAGILQRLDEPERALTAAEHTLSLEPGNETAEAVKAWALEQLAAGESEAGDEVEEPAA
ncbi:MAG: hypothetical protein SX243_07790 [Acidobacteriota bacterium]|nr:hypothetical protein [Acidobacteriota bacterium]